jgi:hypothetical protein
MGDGAHRITMGTGGVGWVSVRDAAGVSRLTSRSGAGSGVPCVRRKGWAPCTGPAPAARPARGDPGAASGAERARADLVNRFCNEPPGPGRRRRSAIRDRAAFRRRRGSARTR